MPSSLPDPPPPLGDRRSGSDGRSVAGFRSNDTITIEPVAWTVETEKFKAPGTPPPEVNEGQLSDHPAVSARWRWIAR